MKIVVKLILLIIVNETIYAQLGAMYEHPIYVNEEGCSYYTEIKPKDFIISKSKDSTYFQQALFADQFYDKVEVFTHSEHQQILSINYPYGHPNVTDENLYIDSEIYRGNVRKGKLPHDDYAINVHVEELEYIKNMDLVRPFLDKEKGEFFLPLQQEVFRNSSFEEQRMEYDFQKSYNEISKSRPITNSKNDTIYTSNYSSELRWFQLEDQRNQLLLLKKNHSFKDFEVIAIENNLVKSLVHISKVKVICPTEFDDDLLFKIEEILIKSKLLKNRKRLKYDNKFKKALYKYQEINNLPIGLFDMKTIEHFENL